MKAQLVYEIQGPIYLNPDAAAQLEDVRVESINGDRVRVSGIKGLPPSFETKLVVCAFGGYQAEVSSYAVGLDIKEKVELQKAQIMRLLDQSKYTKISIETYGTAPMDPTSQKSCSVQIRHFVQAQTKEAIEEFRKVFYLNSMQSYAGYHM